jgi:tetratricopeptide (TPR) repeat protein
MEQYVDLYPNNTGGIIILAGHYRALGQLDRAIELYRRNIEVDPEANLARVSLVQIYTEFDRFTEAHAEAEHSSLIRENPDRWHLARLRLAYAEGDAASAEKEIQALAGTASEQNALRQRAQLMAAHGKLREATALLRRPVVQSRGNPPPPDQQLRLYRALVGLCDEGSATNPQAAVFFCGDSAGAAKLLDATPAPKDTLDKVNAALLRGLAALAARQPEQTIDLLEQTRPYEQSNFAQLVPLARGLALLELKKPGEAATELRKLIARKAQILTPAYAPAHVHLARALAQAGNQAEAKKTYEALFTLWKDADSDIPLLIAARKEFDSLQ